MVLPGTAFVELAVRAGDAAGCGRVEELTLETPLVLPADGGAQVQVTVGGPGPDGRREVAVYARDADAGPDQPWTRHASGLLGPVGQFGPVGLLGPVGQPGAAGSDAGLAAEFAVWPPRGAVPVETGGLYPAMAAGGYGYGPAFRGLRAAWQRGQDLFAEVVLPAEAGASGAFGVHPALLDAALHAVNLGGGPADAREVMLPFAWTGVSVYQAGASVLRVRLRQVAGRGWALDAADGTGLPVVSVAVAGVPAGAGRGARGRRDQAQRRAVRSGMGTGPGHGRPGRGTVGRPRRGPARTGRGPGQRGRVRGPGRAGRGAGGRRTGARRAAGVRRRARRSRLETRPPRRGRRSAGSSAWCSSGWPRSGWRTRGWSW